MDLIADNHDLVHDLVSLIEVKCRTVPVHQHAVSSSTGLDGGIPAATGWFHGAANG